MAGLWGGSGVAASDSCVPLIQTGNYRLGLT
jgi:hypothetical protein